MKLTNVDFFKKMLCGSWEHAKAYSIVFKCLLTCLFLLPCFTNPVKLLKIELFNYVKLIDQQHIYNLGGKQINFFFIMWLLQKSYSIGLVKTESVVIFTSVETGLGRRTLVVAVISVDFYQDHLKFYRFL